MGSQRAQNRSRSRSDLPSKFTILPDAILHKQPRLLLGPPIGLHPLSPAPPPPAPSTCRQSCSWYGWRWLVFQRNSLRLGRPRGRRLMHSGPGRLWTIHAAVLSKSDSIALVPAKSAATEDRVLSQYLYGHLLQMHSLRLADIGLLQSHPSRLISALLASVHPQNMLSSRSSLIVLS